MKKILCIGASLSLLAVTFVGCGSMSIGHNGVKAGIYSETNNATYVGVRIRTSSCTNTFGIQVPLNVNAIGQVIGIGGL